MDAAKGAQRCTAKSGLKAGQDGFTAHCAHCRHESLFAPAPISHRRHLLISLLTGGLWLIPWSALLIGKLLRPWRCSACGWHKPEFRGTAHIPCPPKPGATPKKMQPPTVE